MWWWKAFFLFYGPRMLFLLHYLDSVSDFITPFIIGPMCEEPTNQTWMNVGSGSRVRTGTGGRGWFRVTQVLGHYGVCLAAHCYHVALGTSHWRQIYWNIGRLTHHSSLKYKWQQLVHRPLWNISKAPNSSPSQYPSWPWVLYAIRVQQVPLWELAFLL